ncbi:MAG: hypothetical protein AAFR65_04760 [Pseudomonadota bacterium]
MAKQLKIRCSRSTADAVEAKLLELDQNAQIEMGNTPKLVGVVEGLSIVASLSTVAASSFVIWAEMERRNGKPIEVADEDEAPSAEETDG